MKKFSFHNPNAMAYFVSFSLLVVLPFACGVFAFLWSAVCDALFIPGAFLVLVAVPFALVFSLYCAPVRHLFESLNFSTDAFGKLLHNITGRQYPSDLQAWLAVALFYVAIAMVVAICVNALRARRHKAHF
jgi:hypothetical protein